MKPFDSTVTISVVITATESAAIIGIQSIKLPYFATFFPVLDVLCLHQTAGWDIFDVLCATAY